MEFVLQWYELLILTSAAVIFGYMAACILCAASRADDEAEIYANGLIDRDSEIKKLQRTISNQAQKINELLSLKNELMDTIESIDNSKIIKVARSN